MRRTIGQTFHNYNQVTSTNDLAREKAELGEEEGLVISADEQTAGRGRLGRSWIAPPGTSIQLSVLLRPRLSPRSAHGITQMAALAIANTLREIAEANPINIFPVVSLKWPNDVLLNGMKCAGILVETRVENETLVFAILGIGINVNFAMRIYPELSGFATTLSDVFGKQIDRSALRNSLLDNLDAYYRRLVNSESGPSDILKEWRAELGTLGQTVRVLTQTGIEVGIAEDVDIDGALLLRQADKMITLYSGDVTILS